MDKNNKQNKVKNFFSKHLIAVIDCVGCCIVIATFIPIFFVNTLWQSIFVSISINILTSLLVLTFVDRIIDSQRKKENIQNARINEKQKILRYYKAIKNDLTAYIVEFNQLTTPYSKRKNVGSELPFSTKEFNINFSLQDLIDFDMLDMTIYGRYAKQALISFKEIQNRLYDAFDKYIKEIDFIYFNKIEKSILDIISSKDFPNSIDNLMLLMNQRNNNENFLLNNIKSFIEQYNGNPLEDINSRKYNGNICINILTFYVFLILISNNIKAFISNIKELQG